MPFLRPLKRGHLYFAKKGTFLFCVDTLDSLAERVDFLARLCAAWDFGILPGEGTVNEILREEWRPAVEACRLLTSPACHLLRRWHGLTRLPYLGQEIALIRDDPCLADV